MNLCPPYTRRGFCRVGKSVALPTNRRASDHISSAVGAGVGNCNSFTVPTNGRLAGDSRLKKLEAFQRMPILEPAEFLEIVKTF